MATKPKSTERAVIVTTSHRGVFFGYTDADSGAEIIHLKRARMAIRFGTTRGLMQLAQTGPTLGSKISDRADLEVRSITAVFAVTDEAVKAWEAA